MGSPDTLEFSRLWLPRPLDPARVRLLLERLAADPMSPHLVLETRATAVGVAHLAAVHPPQIPWLYQTLRDLVPGIVISSKSAVLDRPACMVAAEIGFVPDAVALKTDDPVGVTTAILSALGSQLSADGDTLVVQCMLGPRRGGQHVSGETADPHQTIWSRLSHGIRPLPAGTRWPTRGPHWSPRLPDGHSDRRRHSQSHHATPAAQQPRRCTRNRPQHWRAAHGKALQAKHHRRSSYAAALAPTARAPRADRSDRLANRRR